MYGWKSKSDRLCCNFRLIFLSYFRTSCVHMFYITKIHIPTHSLLKRWSVFYSLSTNVNIKRKYYTMFQICMNMCVCVCGLWVCVYIVDVIYILNWLDCRKQHQNRHWVAVIVEKWCTIHISSAYYTLCIAYMLTLFRYLLLSNKNMQRNNACGWMCVCVQFEWFCWKPF